MPWDSRSNRTMLTYEWRAMSETLFGISWCSLVNNVTMVRGHWQYPLPYSASVRCQARIAQYNMVTVVSSQAKRWFYAWKLHRTCDEKITNVKTVTGAILLTSLLTNF